MKFRYIISIALILINSQVFSQDTLKNLIGIELIKPVDLMVIGPLFESRGYTIELMYSRKLNKRFYARGTAGYAKNSHTKDISDSQYQSEGAFLKAAIDFRQELKRNKVFFITSVGFFHSMYEEKARGLYTSHYQDGEFYSPYFVNSREALGPELAFRLAWKLNSFLYWELSNRLSIPLDNSLSSYTPGVSNALQPLFPFGFGIDGKIIVGF